MDPTHTEKDQYLKSARRYTLIFFFISILGILAGVAGMFGISQNSNFDTSLGVVLISTVILLLSISAWNKSRLAALLLIVWLVLMILLEFTENKGALDAGNLRTIIYIGIATLLLWKLIGFHRSVQKTDEPVGGSAFLRYGGVVLAFPLLAFMALGYWALSSNISTAVISGDDIPEEQIVWMQENEMLQAGEKPLLFYSEGIVSIAEGGNLLTNKFVGSWWQEDGQIGSAWYRHGTYCRIEEIESDSFFSDAVFRIHGPEDENYADVWLSVEGDKHQDFIRRAKYLNDRNLYEETKLACKESREIDHEAIALENGFHSKVVSATDVTDDQVNWMVEQKYLLPEEDILAFFSSATYEIADGGTLLTPDYFGGWGTSDGERFGWWAELGSLCVIKEADEKDEDEELMRFFVSKKDDDWFKFSLPKADYQSDFLIEQLKAKNTAKMTEEQIEECSKLESAESPEAESSPASPTPSE